ncbi:ATP-binding protein [Alicyclobacillus macrosporangiidus]|uniref:histidine kinase n=1 Tax=Alicyclobacillus macrosporangiidus TaxID=392015 RepID=A0A1I7F4A7_9BACL|nr:ATP-binding protein [Alicyclobacillus macrosporangiidus]SFU31051.1 two-component system, chemotaxis family, CheB/CheR fusion protein [Alicyclobacillus macrosporangiidus]
MFKDVLNDLESALKELSDINRALDEALVVAVTDHRGNITFANEKFCEISKYSHEELLGQNHRIVNSGYHSKEFFRQMWRTIARGQVWRGEIRNRAKDGTYYWMDTTIVPLLNERGKPYKYVSFRIDITERKRAEELLRRSDKIEAAAQLASSIAHEIRNPLAAIKWSLQTLQLEGDENRKQVDLILSEIDRIDGIVGDFLMLAKPGDSAVQMGDIRTLLASTVQLMQIHARKQGVRIVMDFADPLPSVRMAESQMKQVFINLIKNAIEAMPGGGQITVHAEPLEPGRVRVRVVDQGPGIPEDQLARLGEPFFTTKEKGTGLGLMISDKIVKQHGGTLSIQSQVGKGTTVEVVLPAAGGSTSSAS